MQNIILDYVEEKNFNENIFKSQLNAGRTEINSSIFGKGFFPGNETLNPGKEPTPPTPEQDAYLTFSSDELFIISTTNGEPSWDGTLEYSTDIENWTEWDGTEVSSSDDGKLYFRGSGNTVISLDTSEEEFRLNPWIFDGENISCSGNIETLLDYQTVLMDEHPTMGVGCYATMFDACSSLTAAPELPATTLTERCYFQMFQGCTSLTTPPELPATTLANRCYMQMFASCVSLTTAPVLPATTLADGCYVEMFSGCIALTTTPDLPATTLAVSCCDSMFIDCTSLITAPELPAATLAEGCYNSMFCGCTALISAPELPATTLTESCYGGMFYGCTSIKLSETQTDNYTIPYRIPTTGTGTSATDALSDMFTNTGGTFTGTPEINTTYYLHKDNHIV